MRRTVLYICLSFAGILSIGIFSSVRACQCQPTNVCQAFNRATAVFIGKLIKVDYDEKALHKTVYAHFEVERGFKGTVAKTEVVKFVFATCEIPIKVGEKYFVYKDKEADSPSYVYCHRTGFLSTHNEDLEYANSLSQTKPIYTISGKVIIAPSARKTDTNIMQSIKVMIEDVNDKYEKPLNDDGSFNFTVNEDGVYKVRILMPFDADSLWGPVAIKKTADGTSAEFSTRFKPNGCYYGEFGFQRADSARPTKAL